MIRSDHLREGTTPEMSNLTHRGRATVTAAAALAAITAHGYGWWLAVTAAASAAALAILTAADERWTDLDALEAGERFGR